MISENGSLVEFHRDAVQNNFKSGKEGRPVYDEFDFVRIMTPGDTRTVINRKASDQDKQKYPKAWEIYARGLEEVTEGTPLTQWNGISRSQVKELQHVNVRTVEQFASVSDANIQRLGPGYPQLQKRAQQFLDASQGEAKATEAARENEQLKEKMALMQEQIDAMKAQLAEKADDAEKADEAEKPRRGRPPKED